jgi:hypothetical protein
MPIQDAIRIPISVEAEGWVLTLLHMANCLCPKRTHGVSLLGRVNCEAHRWAGDITNPDHVVICADHGHRTPA